LKVHNTSQSLVFGGSDLANPILYVVLDGVGDRPTPEQGDKTPLEAASTPNLDRFAALGRMGIVYTVKKGIAPESDAGVFSLLSYDPSTSDLSRGVVEAMGSDLDFSSGDLALRCNFATVQNGQIIDRRAGRNVTVDQAKQLVTSLNEDPALKAMAGFELKATIGHRCALVIKGEGRNLSDSISNLDPAYTRSGRVSIAKAGLRLPVPIPKCVPLNRTKDAARTAQLLNKFAARVHDVLEVGPVNVNRREKGDLPANYLLMRDAGTKVPRVRTLQQKFGFRSIALADMPVELGIAKVVGMNIEVFPADHSLAGYSQRARRSLELLDRYDLVYVHLKGPDEFGHDGDFEGKRKSIEDIDAAFFGGLVEMKSRLMCITADHSTPCVAKGHTDDPVPILITGTDYQSDGSLRFTESYAKKGRLGIIRHGYEILKILARMRGLSLRAVTRKS
jgi:2,3-bisphosphoglycerate-independent phosphoglycerate mutase